MCVPSALFLRMGAKRGRGMWEEEVPGGVSKQSKQSSHGRKYPACVGFAFRTFPRASVFVLRDLLIIQQAS